MDRREFVKDSIMMAGGALLPINGAGAYPAENLKVDYVSRVFQNPFTFCHAVIQTGYQFTWGVTRSMVQH